MRSCDGQITPGQEWLTQIEVAFNSARAAVPLVSPNFLASQSILNVELQTILDRAQSGGVVPFWCLVRDCMWQETPLWRYQAAHDSTRVWNKLRQWELDELLRDLGNKIKEEFGKSPAPLPPALESLTRLPARSTVSAPVEPRVLPEAELEAHSPQVPVETDSSLWRKAAGILADIDDLVLIEEVGSHFLI